MAAAAARIDAATYAFDIRVSQEESLFCFLGAVVFGFCPAGSIDVFKSSSLQSWNPFRPLNESNQSESINERG